MTFWKWSQTASSNGTADSTCPFPEGMAPSAVNDGVRGAMAALAKYRDDIAGLTVTAGTSTAYTFGSFQVFDSFAHMNGAMIAFAPHATNGATVTINVDGLGAKPLRTAPGVELLAGTIVQGTPYAATYNNSTGEWILHGFYGNPYNVPLAAGFDFWGTTAPNSSFAFPAGQAISRTTYATLFAIMGTAYGNGDGSTTFNLPDKTGRVSAMKEASAARLTSGFFGGNSTAMGATGGAESHTLTMAEMPAHAHGVTDNGHSHGVHVQNFASLSATSGPVTVPESNSGTIFFGGTNPAGSTDTANAGISVNNNGGGSPHGIVQPTIICNYILRII
jgi:microcystin-dependent protein